MSNKLRVGRLAVVVSVIGGLLVGCGMEKSAKDAATSSGQAAAGSTRAANDSDIIVRTSGRAADASEIAAKDSDLLTAISTAAYNNGRTGATRDRRNQDLAAMDSKRELDTKIGDAGVYFSGFQFQYWDSGIPGDSYVKRMGFFDNAVLEFFRAIQDYVETDPTQRSFCADTTPPAPPAVADLNAINRRRNLLALSVAMHSVVLDQSLAAAKSKFQAVSMYDLISQGLKADADVESGHIKATAQEPYLHDVQVNATDAIYLLQLRYNVFAASLIKDFANQLDIANMLNMPTLFKNWSPDFGPYQETAQVDDAINRVMAAAATAAVLKSVGVDPVLDNTPLPKVQQILHKDAGIADLFAKLDLSGRIKGGKVDPSTPRGAALVSLLQLLKTNFQAPPPAKPHGDQPKGN